MMKSIYLLLILVIIGCKEKSMQIENRTYYNISGNLKSIYYEDKEGELNGIMTIYYESGRVESSSNFIHGKITGIRNYYKDNEVNSLEIISLEIKDSLRHVTVLFENGMKGQEGYQLGKNRIGKWFVYNSNGILTDSINYGGKVPKFDLKN